jgi:hypothetical protein
MTIFDAYDSLQSTPERAYAECIRQCFIMQLQPPHFLTSVRMKREREKLLKPKSLHHEVMTNGPFTDPLRLSSNPTIGRIVFACQGHRNLPLPEGTQMPPLQTEDVVFHQLQ